MVDESDILWGCNAISDFIDRSPRATYHLLESKKIPAGKIGANWIGSKRAITKHIDKITGRGTIDEPS